MADVDQALLAKFISFLDDHMVQLLVDEFTGSMVIPARGEVGSTCARSLPQTDAVLKTLVSVLYIAGPSLISAATSWAVPAARAPEAEELPALVALTVNKKTSRIPVNRVVRHVPDKKIWVHGVAPRELSPLCRISEQHPSPIVSWRNTSVMDTSLTRPNACYLRARVSEPCGRSIFAVLVNQVGSLDLVSSGAKLGYLGREGVIPHPSDWTVVAWKGLVVKITTYTYLRAYQVAYNEGKRKICLRWKRILACRGTRRFRSLSWSQGTRRVYGREKNVPCQRAKLFRASQRNFRPGRALARFAILLARAKGKQEREGWQQCRVSVRSAGGEYETKELARGKAFPLRTPASTARRCDMASPFRNKRGASGDTQFAGKLPKLLYCFYDLRKLNTRQPFGCQEDAEDVRAILVRSGLYCQGLRFIFELIAELATAFAQSLGKEGRTIVLCYYRGHAGLQLAFLLSVQSVFYASTADAPQAVREHELPLGTRWAVCDVQCQCSGEESFVTRGPVSLDVCKWESVVLRRPDALSVKRGGEGCALDLWQAVAKQLPYGKMSVRSNAESRSAVSAALVRRGRPAVLTLRLGPSVYAGVVRQFPELRKSTHITISATYATISTTRTTISTTSIAISSTHITISATYTTISTTNTTIRTTCTTISSTHITLSAICTTINTTNTIISTASTESSSKENNAAPVSEKNTANDASTLQKKKKRDMLLRLAANPQQSSSAILLPNPPTESSSAILIKPHNPRQYERVRETGTPREIPPTNGILQYDSGIRNSRKYRLGMTDDPPSVSVDHSSSLLEHWSLNCRSGSKCWWSVTLQMLRWIPSSGIRSSFLGSSSVPGLESFLHGCREAELHSGKAKPRVANVIVTSPCFRNTASNLSSDGVRSVVIPQPAANRSRWDDVRGIGRRSHNVDQPSATLSYSVRLRWTALPAQLCPFHSSLFPYAFVFLEPLLLTPQPSTSRHAPAAPPPHPLYRFQGGISLWSGSRDTKVKPKMKDKDRAIERSQTRHRLHLINVEKIGCCHPIIYYLLGRAWKKFQRLRRRQRGKKLFEAKYLHEKFFVSPEMPSAAAELLAGSGVLQGVAWQRPISASQIWFKAEFLLMNHASRIAAFTAAGIFRSTLLGSQSRAPSHWSSAASWLKIVDIFETTIPCLVSTLSAVSMLEVLSVSDFERDEIVYIYPQLTNVFLVYGQVPGNRREIANAKRERYLTPCQLNHHTPARVSPAVPKAVCNPSSLPAVVMFRDKETVSRNGYRIAISTTIRTLAKPHATEIRRLPESVYLPAIVAVVIRFCKFLEDVQLALRERMCIQIRRRNTSIQSNQVAQWLKFGLALGKTRVRIPGPAILNFGFPHFPGINPGECLDRSSLQAMAASYPIPATQSNLLRLYSLVFSVLQGKPMRAKRGEYGSVAECKNGRSPNKNPPSSDIVRLNPTFKTLETTLFVPWQISSGGDQWHAGDVDAGHVSLRNIQDTESNTALESCRGSRGSSRRPVPASLSEYQKARVASAVNADTRRSPWTTVALGGHVSSSAALEQNLKHQQGSLLCPAATGHLRSKEGVVFVYKDILLIKRANGFAKEKKNRKNNDKILLGTFSLITLEIACIKAILTVLLLQSEVINKNREQEVPHYRALEPMRVKRCRMEQRRNEKGCGKLDISEETCRSVALLGKISNCTKSVVDGPTPLQRRVIACRSHSNTRPSDGLSLQFCWSLMHQTVQVHLCEIVNFVDKQCQRLKMRFRRASLQVPLRKIQPDEESRFVGVIAPLANEMDEAASHAKVDEISRRLMKFLDLFENLLELMRVNCVRTTSVGSVDLKTNIANFMLRIKLMCRDDVKPCHDVAVASTCEGHAREDSSCRNKTKKLRWPQHWCGQAKVHYRPNVGRPWKAVAMATPGASAVTLPTHAATIDGRHNVLQCRRASSEGPRSAVLPLECGFRQRWRSVTRARARDCNAVFILVTSACRLAGWDGAGKECVNNVIDLLNLNNWVAAAPMLVVCYAIHAIEYLTMLHCPKPQVLSYPGTI
ncbi:hypothetical protein PR048_009660 [Dryococelus australis]|uniref:Uncharacterized protein n=1 Tax=Dryococelus australis TaxID=614101 RepID=A0ABQ9I2B8_9NEOP|nr:hypothetical protein PR048_009660 [Dryococelus australis]